MQVNKNFAIDLVHEDPVVVCTQRVIASDSGGPLGHPVVYINLVSNLFHLQLKLDFSFIRDIFGGMSGFYPLHKIVHFLKKFTFVGSDCTVIDTSILRCL